MSSAAAPNLKNRLVQPFGSAQDGFFIKILPGNPPILSQLGIFIFPPHLEGRISTRLRRIFLVNIEPLIDKALSLQCVFVDKYLPASSVGNLYTPQNIPPFQAKIRHCKPLSDIFSARNEKACTVGFLLCWYHID